MSRTAALSRALWLALPASLAASLAAADDIRDIRGPKALFPWELALGVAAAAIVLIIAGLLIWRRLRRRPSRALLPFEIALARLEKIRPLMRPAAVREYSIAISDVVRGYIEAHFRVTATHLTTEEFLHGLLATSSRDLSSHRDLLAHFLEQCDMAKFAGVSLSTPIMEELFDSARAFIVETSRAPAAAPPPASPQPTGTPPAAAAR